MVKPKKIMENLKEGACSSPNKQWRLKLDENENIYGISNFIKSAIKNIDFEEVSKFPNCEKFIKKLTEKYNISENNIVLTASCSEMLNYIFSIYLETNDEVLTNYDLDIKARNMIYLQNALCKDLDNKENFEFDTDEIKQNISNETKIFCCSSPDYNTGELVRPSVLEKLIESYQNVLFVVDCSYINYLDTVNINDYIDLVNKYNNVIIMKSFSYDFALCNPGLCFSISQKEFTDNIKKIVLPSSLNSISLNCGCSILNCEDYFNEIKTLNKSAREMLFKGLSEKGFKPCLSEANFILCDFSNYCDFYYQKLKNNGVIVKKYDKQSPYENCLRITVPKTGGVKYILELLNKKDLLIFNPEGVIYTVEKENKEELLITRENLEKLSQYYDLVIVADRNKSEINYMLNKFELDSFFHYTVTADDIDDTYLKPESNGIFKIIKHCPFKTIKYAGNSVNDIIAGNNANIETIGFAGSGINQAELINNFKHICANHIIKNIDELINFLEKNEQF